MIRSPLFRLVLLSTFVVVFSMATLYCCSVPAAKRAIYGQEEAAKTILDGVCQFVESEHQAMQSYSREALDAHTRELKDIVLVVESICRRHGMTPVGGWAYVIP